MIADEPTFEQSRAIDAPLRGPFLVDAGAGTGKTFTLVQRAVKLVTTGELRPHELLIVTFTNKAANEIAERIARTFASLGVAEVPACTTFHAFAGEIVREFAWAAAGDVPFDARQIDDARARVLFRRVWSEFLEGRLAIDASALPVGMRSELLEREIGALALRLRARDVTIDDFESRARFAARQLAAQTWGATWERGARGGRRKLEPKVERDAASRRAEAEREERNVHTIAALLRRFDAALAREGVVTFGDVTARARALVEIAVVRERVRARIAHALVDEYQDTNPQQLAFLRALFGDGLESVMAVGDVRQAIYGFNGAEPSGIGDFGRLTGCRRFPLTENRRSYQQILDCAHAVLAASDDPLVSLDRPLVAIKGPARDLAVRAQAFGDGESDVASGRVLEAAAVAREVDALLREGVPQRAIALLVRSRTNARPYVDALRERGIAAKMHGGVGFFDAPEICDARAWLATLADPTDRGALVRILQSRTFGFGDGTIARLASEAAREDPGAFARAILLDAAPPWFDAREREGLELVRATAQALAAVATERAPVVARAIADWCGIDRVAARAQPILAEQVRANLDKLVALAESFERERPGARLDDFVAELDEREALDIDEAEADVGLDRIAIVTAHGAKGLEWDYVFVVNVAKTTFPSADRPTANVLDWHERSGALALIYSVTGQEPLRWRMRGEVDVETGERRHDRRKADEEARLFYVAMTRAKTRLSVSGPLEHDRMSPFLEGVLAWGARNGYDATTMALSRERTVEQGSFDFASASVANADAEGLARRSASAALGRPMLALPLATPRARLSYTSIAAHAICPRFARYRYRLRIPDFRDADTPAAGARLETLDPAEDHARFRPLDPARFGSAVHRALELLVRERIERDGARLGDDDARTEQRAGDPRTEDRRAGSLPTAGADAAAPLSIGATVARAASEFELAESERPPLERAVASALAALEGFQPLAAEARFELRTATADLDGAIDAILRAPDGRIAIVDYKTGSTPVAAHRLQLSLYRRALTAGAVDLGRAFARSGDARAGCADPLVAILGIGLDRSDLVTLEPVDDAELEAAIVDAARGGDEPRPGPACARCPYAGTLCPEGLRSLS